MVDVVTLVDEGLGNDSYLLDLGDGRALAVDPSRDLRKLRAAAKDRGLRIAFAADTHRHADFVSGAVELAASDRAEVLASAHGERAFPHVPVDDGSEIDLGGLHLQALTTPGPTYKHVAFELVEGSTTLGVFTGGSLLVGAAARTDLIAPERTEELTRLQYRSLQRLTSLGSAVLTRHRPHLLHHLGDQNRPGPAVLGTRAADSPGPGRVPPPPRSRHSDHRCTAGRSVRRGASARLAVDPVAPGLHHLTRWLVDPGKPLLIVRSPDQDADEIVGQAIKIGYDHTVGELAEDVSTWAAATGQSLERGQ